MNRTTAALGSIAFFIAMPLVVGGLVPYLITGGGYVTPPVFGLWFLPGLGIALTVLAVLLMIVCFARFVMHNGTPAPIAPTARLVVDGPYRYVRNPMYVAVVAAIVGQALYYGCQWVLLYGAGVWLLTHLFVLLYEEPTLRRDYGAEYDTYAANVRRWLPRLTPWRGGLKGDLLS